MTTLTSNIKYETHRFQSASLALIDKTNEIIKEYQESGYDLTLRQLYYQLVARGFIDNNEAQYKKLGSIINNGRLAGLIDWMAITDRTRQVKMNAHWEDPSDILRSAADSYALNTRITQQNYVEVWVEKEALADVIAHACEPLDVPYFSCRGYVSQSAMWRAAQRIRENWSDYATVLYLGDHDPSGIDMTRDIQDRLDIFKSLAEVKRIALNMDQIKLYNPPPNPAKITDSRCASYVAEYGHESWELDALDPRDIHELIEKHVNGLTNKKARQLLVNRQEKERKRLLKLAKDWT